MELRAGVRAVTSRRHSAIKRDQSGLSLVELMVAILVGLILTAGLIQVYLSNKQSYNAQEQLARMQEGGRFALDTISRDLRRAGYWGGNVDLATITGNPGPSDPAHACPGTTLLDWRRMVGWRVSGTNNVQADYSCASNYVSDTDILTIRYAGPAPLDATASLQPSGLYLRSTLNQGRVMTGASAMDAANALPPDGPDTPEHLLAQVRLLVANAYFIGDTGRRCNNQPIPALYRIRLDSSSGLLTPPEEIATGAEQLQVLYLLDEEYVDADAVDLGNRWREVRAVRFWLLVRSECPEPGLDSLTYDLGGFVWPQNSDNFRRQMYVSTVMLRNTLVR